MNRVDSSDEFRRSGRALVTDRGPVVPPGTYPPVSPIRDIEASLAAALEPDRDNVRCLLSRMTSGLGVQALVRGSEAYITVTLNGECETFEVPGDKLLDAFDHPFAYGATLPL